MISQSHSPNTETSTRRRLITYVGILLLFAFGVGVYAVMIRTVTDNRLFLVLFVVPVILSALFTKLAPRLFLGLLVISLSLSARFRLGDGAFHTGGAEAALAPIDFALFGLLFYWLAQHFRLPPRLTVGLTAIEKAYLIFALAHLPALLYAPDAGLAFLEILRLIKMGVLIFVLKQFVRNERDLSFVLSILLLTVFAQGALAFVQARFGSSIGLSFLGERDDVWVVSSGTFSASRAGGTMGHANALAHFFEMTIPLALAIFLNRASGQVRFMALLALAGGTVGLFLTFSRGGWVGSLVGILIVLLANPQLRIKRNRQRIVYYGILAGIALVVLSVFLWPTIQQRVAEFNTVSWLFRFRTYTVALEIIRDNLWFGIGVNNYLQVSLPYSSNVLIAWPEAIVHNAYLLVLAEMGILGFLTFLLLLWSIRRHVKRLVRTRKPPVDTIALGVWGGIVALLVHSLLGWLWRYDPVYTIFWFNVGLLVALSNLLRTDEITDPKLKSCEG